MGNGDYTNFLLLPQGRFPDISQAILNDESAHHAAPPAPSTSGSQVACMLKYATYYYKLVLIVVLTMQTSDTYAFFHAFFVFNLGL